MGLRWRVIGLGRAAAGDDGVGPAVLEAMRSAGVPDGVELVAASDPTRLVELVVGVGAVLLVDAVVGEGLVPGSLVEAGEPGLLPRTVRPLTSHGIDARSALELARVMDPAGIAPRIVVLGVAIAPPAGGASFGLSAPVRQAVGRAAARALELVSLR